MLLFRSEEHINEWSKQRNLPPGATMTIEQQWKLADLWYSDRLEEQWERKTPEEAERVFARVGLEGDFWRLTG